MRSLIAATSYARLRESAAAVLREWTGAPKILVLAGAKEAADDLVRSTLKRGSAGIYRMELAALAMSLAEPLLAQRGLTPLTTLGWEALITRVADRVRRGAGLRYFDPVAGTPGFPRALARTLRDLRLAAVNASTLDGDLRLLLDELRSELREQALADEATVFRLALEALPASDWATAPTLWLDVAPSNASERRLLKELARLSPAVCALSLPEGRTRLERCLAAPIAANQVLAEEQPRAFSFFSAAGEGPECVEIARQILEAARAGVRFDECAILLRSPARYQPLVEEALLRAGIPGYYTRGVRRPDPAGRGFLALLECAREGCSAARFAEFLSFGQANAPSAPASWERMLVDAAVIGGRGRWARRLDGLTAQLRARLEQAGDDERDSLARQLEQIGELRDYALPLIDSLAALPVEAYWRDWLELLPKLAAQALETPDRITELLDELWPLADIGPVTLAEVAAVLSVRLRELRRDPDVRRYGRVFVGAIDEARGLTFRRVFLPGLADGSFPRRALEDPILLDSAREKLSPDLPLRADRLADERELLAIAQACGEQLTASYPRADVALGRRRVPSLYALELVRAATGELPRDLRVFERAATEAGALAAGWPAPKDNALAIDEAEYNLALLRIWMEHAADNAGEAAFLVHADSPLARSLRTRWSRWSNTWRAPDGLILDVFDDALTARSLKNRSYSPSNLEHFAACPYRFYLRAIYGLRPTRHIEQIERMDPIIRGELFHRVLFECSGNRTPIDEALNKVAAEYFEEYAPAIPAVWREEVEELRADLRGLVERLAHDPLWTRAAAEFAFGMPRTRRPHDDASIAEPVTIFDKYKLHGAIDLIERASNGQLRVTDYKSGAPPDRLPERTGCGEHLQPVLYALAAEQALGAPAMWGRLYYATRRYGFHEHVISIDARARNEAAEILQLIDDWIARGFLPAAPRKDACDDCDYHAVCGPYEEERSQSCKPKLEPLIQVRNAR